jgi:hypothetical protein
MVFLSSSMAISGPAVWVDSDAAGHKQVLCPPVRQAQALFLTRVVTHDMRRLVCQNVRGSPSGLPVWQHLNKWGWCPDFDTKTAAGEG